VIYLALGAIVGYYLKVFFLDRWSASPRVNTLVLLAATLAAACLLRLLMPEL